MTAAMDALARATAARQQEAVRLNDDERDWLRRFLAAMTERDGWVASDRSEYIASVGEAIQDAGQRAALVAAWRQAVERPVQDINANIRADLAKRSAS